MSNPKGTPENLTKPGDGKHYEFTNEDRQKAGKSTKEHYAMAKLLDDFGKLPPDIEDIKKRMRKFGVADDKVTNESAIAVRIIIGARSGDPKMIDRYLEATGQKIIRNVNENHNYEMKPLVDLTKRKKNGEDNGTKQD
jgi:hypothetical protein